MAAPTTAPALSTPAEHIFEEPIPSVDSSSRLSEEQLYIQYEIKRTISEIREGRWKRVALQFPDEMLVDAPSVCERLAQGLRTGRRGVREPKQEVKSEGSKVEDVTEDLDEMKIAGEGRSTDANKREAEDEVEERLCILADTSYGACCVDEVAAEHIDAEVVVHYGRACLSPTARLPVIYVFTTQLLDLEAAVATFKETHRDKEVKVCLMADIPYSHHLPSLHGRLREEGYENVFATEIVRDPSSLLPNRTVPAAVREDGEKLKEYSIFHLSTPPTSLLLILSSRVKTIHILPTSTTTDTATRALEPAATTPLLRRRYALLTRLSAAPILGILINTLSVSNYMEALQHCQDLISRAGKKSYVFVVGKVNSAKIANFAEIGGWVVVGCWESSLLESRDFVAPIVTPFELEVALQRDEERRWGGEWVGNFQEVLGRRGDDRVPDDDGLDDGENQESASEDDEPPDFDLRTGKYVSRSRPMRSRRRQATAQPSNSTSASALVPRDTDTALANINGTLSPAAQFLREKRTWQGLGSDYEIAYERDEEGKIRGAAMEEGRTGVARGYTVGDEGARA